MQEDFHGFCAYCGVHEGDWPHGRKNYQLDHFKPKSVFGDLINDFYNLRWCCHICNRMDAKGDNWPSSEEMAKGMGFVDLCEDEWQTHYAILPDGKLEALSVKAKFTLPIIGLNDDDYVEQRIEIFRKGKSIFCSNQ